MKTLLDISVTMKMVALKLVVVAISGVLFYGVPGCANFPAGNNSCALKQAFGNAIRSLEGTALAQDATRIPAALQSLANLWLPQNGQFASFVGTQINAFVAAHPITPGEVDAALEVIAMQVQSGC